MHDISFNINFDKELNFSQSDLFSEFLVDAKSSFLVVDINSSYRLHFNNKFVRF